MKIFFRSHYLIYVLACCFFSGLTSAETVSTSTSVSLSSYDPLSPGSRQSPIHGLEPFDPSLGVLTSVEFVVDYDYDITHSLSSSILDLSLPHYVDASMYTGMMLSIPTEDNSLSNIAYAYEGDTHSCSGEAFSVVACTENIFPVNYNNTGNGAEDILFELTDNNLLSMFVRGDGNNEVIGVNLKLYDEFSENGSEFAIYSENIDLNNLSYNIDFDISAEVTLNYHYEPYCGGTSELPNNQWQQISLPCESFDLYTVADIFSDDIPGPYGIDWAIYRFDAVNNNYVELEMNSNLEQGIGYWIIQISGESQTLDMAGYLINSFYTDLVTKPSGIQWNLIGYPFTTDRPLGDVRVLAFSDNDECNPYCTLDFAQSKNIVRNKVWNYNGVSYDQINTSDNLKSWRGYWSLTLEDADGKEPSLEYYSEFFGS